MRSAVSAESFATTSGCRMGVLRDRNSEQFGRRRAMRSQLVRPILPACVIAAVVLGGLQGRAQAPAAAVRPYTGARTADGKPNLNGIWQVVNEAHWDLEPH